MFLGNRVVHFDSTLRCAAEPPASRAQTGRYRIAVRVLCGLAVILPLCGCASLPSVPPPPAAPGTASAGGATIVAIAPPSPPAMTLPKFLGLDIAYAGIRGIGMRVRNRLGTRFPGLEPKPPIRSIADPANMSENASPAVKAAAEAKIEADQAPQKAKAIRYLSSLGCGKCYPDTEKALLAAMEDCNEQIRYEAVRGLRKSVGDQCGCCRQDSCCSPKLVQKLYELAYGVDDSGCHIEPSSRIRRNARLAICACGAVTTDGDEALPIEGPQVLVQSDSSESDAASPKTASEESSPADAPSATATVDIQSTQQRTATILLNTPEAVATDETPSKDQTAGLMLPDDAELPPDANVPGGVRRE